MDGSLMESDFNNIEVNLMKSKTLIISILLSLIATVVLFLCGGNILREHVYNQAVENLKQEKYEMAISSLKYANKIYSNYDIYSFEETDYKDSGVLLAYAIARSEYENGDNMNHVNGCLEYIPKNYNGELSQEINLFKKAFKPEYDKYAAEQEKIQKEEFLKKAATYADKMPYEGMSEQYIDYTFMGIHDEYESKIVGKGLSRKATVHNYYWNNTYGDTILLVKCRDRFVDDIIRYGTYDAWTSDGKPIYSVHNSPDPVYSIPDMDDDPYNVHNYSNEEDFYYDHYDDFFSYEDAEDYYNEHY